MIEITPEKVVDILNSCMEKADISQEQHDEDLTLHGMDSISFIRFIVSLEEEFMCEIPDEYLLLSEMNTVNKILDVLKSII